MPLPFIIHYIIKLDVSNFALVHIFCYMKLYEMDLYHVLISQIDYFKIITGEFNVIMITLRVLKKSDHLFTLKLISYYFKTINIHWANQIDINSQRDRLTQKLA